MTIPALTESYSELVRRYFFNPVHADRLPNAYNDVVVSEAAESEMGVRVVLSAVVDGDTIRFLRYRIFGCPHLIAAAESFCDEVEGQAISALLELNVPDLMDKLTIPVEKTGSIFILEDAVKILHIALMKMTHIEN
jgi:NifU-like protein involved in Fe-S cluster formation